MRMKHQESVGSGRSVGCFFLVVFFFLEASGGVKVEVRADAMSDDSLGGDVVKEEKGRRMKGV